MITQYEAVIEAFRALGSPKRIGEIEDWIFKQYGMVWKDIGTVMADMVSEKNGGNKTSNVSEQYRILIRESRGVYSLIQR